MANIITTSDFKGLFQLSTSSTSVATFITEIITQVEASELPKLTYVEEDEENIKAMLIRFVYALYQGKQTKVNQQVGNVKLNPSNAEIVLENDEAYAYYNEAVKIFNDYVTLVEDKKNYINKYGI
jgi:hypothetical protein